MYAFKSQTNFCFVCLFLSNNALFAIYEVENQHYVFMSNDLYWVIILNIVFVNSLCLTTAELKG